MGRISPGLRDVLRRFSSLVPELLFPPLSLPLSAACLVTREGVSSSIFGGCGCSFEVLELAFFSADEVEGVLASWTVSRTEPPPLTPRPAARGVVRPLASLASGSVFAGSSGGGKEDLLLDVFATFVVDSWSARRTAVRGGMLDLSASGVTSTTGAGSCGLLVWTAADGALPGVPGPRLGLISWLLVRDCEEARVVEVEVTDRSGGRAGEGSRDELAVDAGAVRLADDSLGSGDMEEEDFLELERRGSIMSPSPPPLPTRREAVEAPPRLLSAALERPDDPLDAASGLLGPVAITESNQVADATGQSIREDGSGRAVRRGPAGGRGRFRRVPEARYADDRLARRTDPNHMLRGEEEEEEEDRTMGD